MRKCLIVPHYAFQIKIFPLVAQLDNAADSDSEERGFESLRAGQSRASTRRRVVEALLFFSFFSRVKAVS